MKVTLWGTRGSLACPGPLTERFGGNTSCVEVRGTDGTVLVLDAGTGIRPLGLTLIGGPPRVDILLTHLHLDHILGLGFFAPLFVPGKDVHCWGPASTTLRLRDRLMRYLSPPLFPVHLRDLPCKLTLHEVPCDDFEVGEFRISTSLVCHPGPSVGYRIADSNSIVAYLPDHEPALGAKVFPLEGHWTSGYSLADGADVLIHDSQYSQAEYPNHIGWGHSSLEQSIEFAYLAQVKRLVPFHHDPGHNDSELEQLLSDVMMAGRRPVQIIPGMEGMAMDLANIIHAPHAS